DVSFIAVATDDVAPTSFACLPSSGARFPLGPTTVSCSAGDAASHVTTATFVITVVSAADQLAQLRTIVAALTIDPSVKQGLLDKLDAARRTIASGPAKTTGEPPNLSVPADITVAAPAGSSTAIVTFTVTATDNSGAATAVTCDHASGSAFAWGMTTVTCTAVDAAGNSATRSFHVSVNFAISGRITDGATNAAIPGVRVVVQDAATENDVAAGTSGADGTYSIVVHPGRYVAVFNRDQGVPYVEEYWNERFISSPHDVITVAGSTDGINAPLVAGYYVHGQVTDAMTGLPVEGDFAAGGYVGGTGAFAGSQTGIDGTYRFVAARGAMIKVTFTKSHYM